MILKSLGDWDAGESAAREALAIRRKRLDPAHPNITASLNNLAVFVHERGDSNEADELFREVLARQRVTWGDHNEQVAIALNNLAVVLSQNDDPESAEPLVREALEIAADFFGPEHPRVAKYSCNLAGLLHDAGKNEEAESLYGESLEIVRRQEPVNPYSLGMVLYDFATFLIDRGEPLRAEPLLREALEAWNSTGIEGSWELAMAQGALGRCLTKLQRFEDAEALLLQSYEFGQANFGDFHDRALQPCQYLAELYDAWNKPEQAAEWRAKLPPAPPPKGGAGLEAPSAETAKLFGGPKRSFAAWMKAPYYNAL